MEVSNKPGQEEVVALLSDPRTMGGDVRRVELSSRRVSGRRAGLQGEAAVKFLSRLPDRQTQGACEAEIHVNNSRAEIYRGFVAIRARQTAGSLSAVTARRRMGTVERRSFDEERDAR